MTIQPADTRTFEDVLALLVTAGLPTDGLHQHLGTTLVAIEQGRVVGSAAVEVYADGTLLRSVAVSPEARGRGVGRALTESALELVRSYGSPAVYLLTTTAASFFPRFAFEQIDRDAAPVGVRTSVEFLSACPASAILMRRSF